MTSLEKFIQSKGQEIEQSLHQISEIQKQLNELQQQIRVQQQIHQAQKTSEVEVSKHLNSLKKLFKDLCCIYPVEAIDNLVQDITEMAEEVKENYGDYAQSGRFLNGDKDDETDNQSITDAKDLPLIIESLPDENDDETILSPSQVETIISNKGEDTQTFLKQQLGISGKVKRLSVIASKMADHKLTRKRLEQLIKAAELIRERPVINGASSINASSS